MTDGGRTGAVPPGWPEHVPGPGAAGWVAGVQGWLWELLPAQYRAYELLRREPVLLARQVLMQVEAELVALRKGFGSARSDLAGLGMAAGVVEEAMELYRAEAERLRVVALQVRLVTDELVHGAGRHPG